MTVTDGGIPQAVLKPQQRMTKEQAEEFRESVDGGCRLARRGARDRPAGPRVRAAVVQPVRPALLETQEWNARVLATAFGVPAVILNMALQGGLTYQNPAALARCGGGSSCARRRRGSRTRSRRRCCPAASG